MRENFTFTINESLFFDRHQQIREMLGIGIEPVISIQEADDSLSLRGVMELKGEYIKDENVDDNVMTERNNDHTYVENIRTLSDEVNEFFHKLLVDITVPSERIQSIDDVELEIDHFDYTLKSNEEMLIEATLLINGINETEVDQDIDLTESLPAFEQNRNNDEELEEKKDDLTDREVVWEREENEETVKESINKDTDEGINSVEESEMAEVETVETRPEEEEPNLETEEDIESLENIEEEKEDTVQVRAQSSTDEEATYLLSIFQKEDASAVRKLKLYIVQPKDEIEQIASRYEVSSRQIVRTNRLENDDITPGQIIYIPIQYEQ